MEPYLLVMLNDFLEFVFPPKPPQLRRSSALRMDSMLAENIQDVSMNN